MTETFTDRYLDAKTVAKIDQSAVTDTDGWTAIAPVDARPLLRPGARYELETRGGPFGRITGWRIEGRWFGRRSDQQLEAERRQLVEDTDRRHREALDANREDWTRRTVELPHWVRTRLETFLRRGGERFEREGWGYELCVAELAVMYAASGGLDSEQVNTYAADHGTSGNQHDCAKALAREHAAGGSLAGTVSALLPLTGDAFYDAGGAA